MPDDLIGLALDEDIGPGDVTAKWFTGNERRASAVIIAREACCLAGIGVCAEVFSRVDKSLRVTALESDGANLNPGEPVLRIEGLAASILTAERTSLNFLQRLSGVATMARRYVEAVRGTDAVILDTRKTTPGFRLLEKAAVAAAGATNHRAGLYDMVMVKDNHLAAGTTLDDIQSAIRRVKAENPALRIEIEADTVAQARDFFQLDGVDVVLLDNMPPASLREAVALRPPHIRLEASGGITLANIRAVAETGVDFISIGAITHSAPAVDFSLELTAIQGLSGKIAFF
ncbi:MAG: carboxylating nicotinate-nucleotide diphosphorylase [Verrucomicrobia bacterium]|nr:carboxylating nicotinate-nucleotide diphosphorylase [Verrucomicrobiota bacterium]